MHEGILLIAVLSSGVGFFGVVGVSESSSSSWSLVLLFVWLSSHVMMMCFCAVCLPPLRLTALLFFLFLSFLFFFVCILFFVLIFPM